MRQVCRRLSAWIGNIPSRPLSTGSNGNETLIRLPKPNNQINIQRPTNSENGDNALPKSIQHARLRLPFTIVLLAIRTGFAYQIQRPLTNSLFTAVDNH